MEIELGVIIMIIGFAVMVSGASERVKIESPWGISYNGPAGILLIIFGALINQGVI